MTVFAAERDIEISQNDILSTSDDLIRDFENKSGPVKDRSKIPESAQTAVYIDSEMSFYSDFSSMWNKAMENVPNIAEIGLQHSTFFLKFE